MKPILALALLSAVAACDAPPGGGASDEVGDPVAISLLDDGTIMLDDEEVTVAELSDALEDIEATRVVTVETQPEVTYKAVDEVQKALVAAGVARVVVLTEL